MTWDPPDVPLEELPFFTSQYHDRFITFELTPEELIDVRWEAVSLKAINNGDLSLDDVALFDYALCLMGRDLALAREAADLISDPEERRAAHNGIDAWEYRDVR
jgi:hypothetical protein